MVSDKMLQAHRRAYGEKCNDGNSGTRTVLKSALQAGINEAWIKFDHHRVATWPENMKIGLLVKCGEAPHGYEVAWFEHGQFYSCGVTLRDPVEYLLIADILPEDK